ncbi:heparinase II/III family protein [Paenibacillus arenilitoris]|uniref:Heparinase II/III family protein n=1 Tax=Paenibacillus arenilitoris TaxID=2772299 RepID=A0A927H3H3_9BACL|nr:heparinase II/III family protein [Paenibacillus arenilitoris]MBD2867331.1 heparinase II/III family protein [Paenibacillus arenilitoris]
MPEVKWTRDTLEEWLHDRPPEDRRMYAEEGAATDWQAIAASPHYAEMAREVEEEGGRLLESPIPELTPELYGLFEKTGNRLTFESVYFERRRRLTAFALLHLLYPGEETYRESLVEIVEAILIEPTWCLPAHLKGQAIDRHIDLFAAETGFALCEIAAMTGDGLPERLRQAMLEQVDKRLFVPYLNFGPYHWETAEHNWSAVCAGSIGSAALLAERDLGRTAAIAEKALGSMGHYLSGFGADGACLEGPGYWNYGFGYFVYFADLLARATGGRADLLGDDKIRTIALFQQRCYLAGNRPANFSDAVPEVNVHIGLSDYLASRYEEAEHPPLAIRASFTDDHCSRFAPALRNFIWFRPDAERDAGWRPGSWYLPDAQWLVSRTVSPAGSFGFAAKGGSNGEPHNHIDVGHFILLADDDPAFAADLGSGEYTADYFGGGRYAYDCTGPHGHSLPVVGGREQAAGADRAAAVLEAHTSGDEDRLELELAACYPGSGLASFRRRLTWRKTGLPVLELNDAFRFAREGEPVTEVVITRCEPQLVADGSVLLRGVRHAVMLEFDPGRYGISTEERRYSNHYGKEERYYRILLTVNEEGAGGLDVAMRFAFQA